MVKEGRRKDNGILGSEGMQMEGSRITMLLRITSNQTHCLASDYRSGLSVALTFTHEAISAVVTMGTGTLIGATCVHARMGAIVSTITLVDVCKGG